ncbi:hypothetical protein GCM10020000_75590 [Streptomyces olivoverticillatus]
MRLAAKSLSEEEKRIIPAASSSVIPTGGIVGWPTETYAEVRSPVRSGGEAGVLQGVPGGLQQHPLLRVQPLGVHRAVAEELRVEGVRVLQDDARGDELGPPHDGGVVAHADEFVRRVPADAAAPLAQQLPQALGGGGGTEAAGQADDGHRVRIVDRVGRQVVGHHRWSSPSRKSAPHLAAGRTGGSGPHRGGGRCAGGGGPPGCSA